MKHKIVSIEILLFGDKFCRVTFGRGYFSPNRVGNTINHREYNARSESQRRLVKALLNTKYPMHSFGGSAQVILFEDKEGQ